MSECPDTQVVTARTVRRDELDDLLTLYQMLNPDDPQLEQSPELRDQWREMLEDDSIAVVVVEAADRLVATCVLSVTQNLTRGARPFAVVENVVTREGCRGQGFGSQCLEKATDIARERGCDKIMLLTGADAEWKHRFYQNCGFDRAEKTGFVRDLRAETGPDRQEALGSVSTPTDD